MRALRLPVLTSALTLILVSGLTAGPDPAAPQSAPKLPEASTRSTVPRSERERPNPLKPEPRSLEEGRVMFQSQCAMCHGARGDGRGDLVERLGMKVPDLTDPQYQAKRTDGEWFYIITKGHGRMPGEGERLAPHRKWQLVNYIRTLAPRPRSAP
jgi:mono/diheme cytochrome c family protein